MPQKLPSLFVLGRVMLNTIENGDFAKTAAVVTRGTQQLFKQANPIGGPVQGLGNISDPRTWQAPGAQPAAQPTQGAQPGGQAKSPIPAQNGTPAPILTPDGKPTVNQGGVASMPNRYNFALDETVAQMRREQIEHVNKQMTDANTAAHYAGMTPQSQQQQPPTPLPQPTQKAANDAPYASTLGDTLRGGLAGFGLGSALGTPIGAAVSGPDFMQAAPNAMRGNLIGGLAGSIAGGLFANRRAKKFNRKLDDSAAAALRGDSIVNLPQQKPVVDALMNGVIGGRLGGSIGGQVGGATGVIAGDGDILTTMGGQGLGTVLGGSTGAIAGGAIGMNQTRDRNRRVGDYLRQLRNRGTR